MCVGFSAKMREILDKIEVGWCVGAQPEGKELLITIEECL